MVGIGRSKYLSEGGFTIQHKVIERALSLPSQQRVISLPHALVMDNSIDPRAKALYLSLIAHKPSSIRELAMYTSINRTVVTKLIHSLVKTGWVIIHETPRKRIMIPTQPLEIQKANLDYVIESDKMSLRSGENKMNLMLDLIVDVSPCIYNARPWFLQNPKSKEFLEYDRFDPEAMRAWEFDGR
jgi:DNA-binding MarR family transcriptional regulator